MSAANLSAGERSERGGGAPRGRPGATASAASASKSIDQLRGYLIESTPPPSKALVEAVVVEVVVVRVVVVRVALAVVEAFTPAPLSPDHFPSFPAAFREKASELGPGPAQGFRLRRFRRQRGLRLTVSRNHETPAPRTSIEQPKTFGEKFIFIFPSLRL